MTFGCILHQLGLAGSRHSPHDANAEGHAFAQCFCSGARLGFDLNPSLTIAQALNDGSRLDDLLLERLLTKHEDHLQVLTAPATLDQSHELAEDAFERVLEVAQANASFVVVDVPRVWTPATWSFATIRRIFRTSQSCRRATTM